MPSYGGEPFDTLTPRERQVVQLVYEGLTTQQIAERLGMRPSTAIGHLAGIYRKLRVSNRRELLALALRHGSIGKGI